MNVDTHIVAGTLVVRLQGDWPLEGALPQAGPLLDASMRAGDVRSVAFDASGLGVWGSGLLYFLNDLQARCEADGLAFDASGLPTQITRLVALARSVPESSQTPAKRPATLIAQLGERGMRAGRDVLAFIRFMGEAALSVLRLLTGRIRFQWRDFWRIVQRNSSGALAIVGLIAFLVGLIVSFLGAVVLRRFGADYYVSYLLSYGMLRELGALMTAIIMAGRTGAAFAAELGSMKITEEIDALRTLGIDPFDFLVLPRLMGVFFMMPLLTVYADFIGLAAGMLVSETMLDVTTTQFLTGLLEPLTMTDALLGIFKGTVFGAIIGLAGCLRGLQTGNDASAVGEATTSAVVTGITLIILANACIDWAAAVLEI
ncbi:MAG: ABC transporter permease [Rhodothermales bacterium]